jgi:protocatechuate 4,5-dioxygenase, alpha chain
MASSPDFDDIPGTFVFDGAMCRKGYHFNMFCMSLMSPDNRAAFKADEGAYIDRFGLAEAQRRAVLARDWRSMQTLGGNIFYIVKLGATDGLSVQHVVARCAGMDPDAYAQMMRGGGRPLAGNRSKLANAQREIPGG